MAASRRFWLVVSSFLVLNALGWVWLRAAQEASSGPQVRLLRIEPGEDAAAADRLRFVIDQAVAPLGGLAASGGEAPALDLEPFQMTPSVAGTWRWVASDALECVLDEPLVPGRTYRVRSAAGFTRLTGRPVADLAAVVLRTGRLAVLSARVAKSDARAATLRIAFNQPVAPADLARALRVAAGGQPLEPAIPGRGAAREHAVLLPPTNAEALTVGIAAGLVTPGGDLGLERDLQLSPVPVPRRFAATGWEVRSGSLDASLSVALEFSRDLDASQAVPKVGLEPPVEGLRVSLGSSSVVLAGPFVAGVPYAATVGPDLLSAAKEPLGEEQRVRFVLPDRDPDLAFTASRGVLSPGGLLTLDLKAVNLSRLQVEIDRVYPNNVVDHVRNPGDTGRTARGLVRKALPLRLPRNLPQVVPLDLGALLPVGKKGIYVVRAWEEGDWWARSRALVTVTDLALTARAERGGLRVWVTSLSRGEPVEGVAVRALSGKNQLLAEAKTDAEGLAALPVSSDHPDGPPAVLTASLEDDLAFLEVPDRDGAPASGDRAGRAAPRGYDVLLYTERGVHRPGEVIHLTGIVRGEGGEVPTPFPLAIRVRRPDGREVDVRTVRPEADAQGAFHLDWPTSAHAPTGGWRFVATLPGADEELGTVTTWVEEFVPARLEVKARTDRARYLPGESPRLGVEARYLFGAPAADLPARVTVEHAPARFASKAFPDHVFGLPGGRSKESPDDVALTLDGKGAAEAPVPLPTSTAKGLWRTSVAASVTAPGGRTVTSSTTVEIDTLGRHLGLRLPGAVVPAEQGVACSWAVVTGGDAPAAPGPFTLAVLRVEERWSVRHRDGRTVWERTETQSLEQEVAVTPAESSGTTEVRFPRAGRFLLRATDSSTGSTTVVDVYATRDGDPEVVATESPERVELVLDQPRYAPGATARVRVRSPFPGTLLLTLETDRVLSTQVLRMEEPTATLEVPVPATLRGGGFLSATVVRAVDPARTEWLPHRASGVARLVTDHASRRLPVAVETEDRVRPGTSLAVRVTTAPPEDADRPGVVHLWAVDDGILLTTAYGTPDPHAHFFAPRRHAVTSGDTYAGLLPDHQRPTTLAKIGGDGGAEESLRRSPVPAQQRVSAVVWRAALALDAEGSARMDLPMPALTGRMRLMAVAVEGDRYGSAERAVLLAAPLQLETSLPRVLAPGDRAETAIRIFHDGAEPLAVTISTSAAGEVSLGDADSPVHETVLVAPGSPVTLWRTLRAKGEGRGRLDVQAEATAADGEPLVATFQGDLPVRSALPPAADVRIVAVEARKPLVLPWPEGLLAAGGFTDLVVGGRPDAPLDLPLQRLRSYPYGCNEQNTSRLWALVVAPGLLEGAGPGQLAAVREEAEELIERLWFSQLPSGALPYWGGSRSPDPWISAYAALVLLRGQAAGLPVEARLLDPLLAYLESLLPQSAEAGVDDDLRARIAEALARAGRPPLGWMAALEERVQGLGPAGRASLALACRAAGRPEGARDLLAQAGDAVPAGSRPGFPAARSGTWQRANLLLAMLEVDPANPAIPFVARNLEEARVGGTWANTLEEAACLAALAAHAHTLPPARPFRGTLRTAAGETPFTSDAVARVRCAAAEGTITVTVEGEGTAYVLATAQGRARPGATGPEDRRLYVRRGWYDRKGNPVDLAKVRVGDLIEVRLAVSTRDPGPTASATRSANEDPLAALVAAGSHRPDADEALRDVVVVDPLPAGLEVENPRLATSWASGEEDGGAERTEWLDDRVLVFTEAGPSARTYRYFVRAVTAGSFERPAVSASSMYDPARVSLHDAGRLEIVR